METATSVNDVPIRLTYERWFHITENHNDLASYYFELLETIEKPDLIVRGNKGTLKVSSELTKLPITHVWADYDKEADVLYLSFRKPQNATKTIESDDDILIRTDGDEIAGLTVLNAGSR